MHLDADGISSMSAGDQMVAHVDEYHEGHGGDVVPANAQHHMHLHQHRQHNVQILNVLHQDFDVAAYQQHVHQEHQQQMTNVLFGVMHHTQWLQRVNVAQRQAFEHEVVQCVTLEAQQWVNQQMMYAQERACAQEHRTHEQLVAHYDDVLRQGEYSAYEVTLRHTEVQQELEREEGRHGNTTHQLRRLQDELQKQREQRDKDYAQLHEIEQNAENETQYAENRLRADLHAQYEYHVQRQQHEIDSYQEQAHYQGEHYHWELEESEQLYAQRDDLRLEVRNMQFELKTAHDDLKTVRDNLALRAKGDDEVRQLRSELQAAHRQLSATTKTADDAKGIPFPVPWWGRRPGGTSGPNLARWGRRPGGRTGHRPKVGQNIHRSTASLGSASSESGSSSEATGTTRSAHCHHTSSSNTTGTRAITGTHPIPGGHGRRSRSSRQGRAHHSVQVRHRDTMLVGGTGRHCTGRYRSSSRTHRGKRPTWSGYKPCPPMSRTSGHGGRQHATRLSRRLAAATWPSSGYAPSKKKAQPWRTSLSPERDGSTLTKS